MRRRTRETLPFLVAVPALLFHCSTDGNDADGDDHPGGGSAGTAAGASAAAGSDSGSGGTSDGGRAMGGGSGGAQGGSSMGGTSGDAGAPEAGSGATGGSAGDPTGGKGGVAGSSGTGQSGSATSGAGGQAGAGAGVGGNAGSAAGMAGGGAAGLGGNGGAAGDGSGGFSCTPSCGAGMMCCPNSALTTSCIPETSAGCLAPDLTVSAERAEQSATVEYRNFATNHCALAEACIEASGRRRLLRFETFTPNIGTADMTLGAPDVSNPVFEYSACHDHFHFKGYAEYDLLDENGTVVATGHKQAFCLLDSERYLTSDNTVRRTARYHCGNQGISRGWGDSYYPDLDCQWVDVTEVPPGDYLLRIRINSARTLLELRYDNNEAIVPVQIP